MKLIDRLMEIPDEEFIYLGCEKGSSYFFIGTCDELESKLDSLDKELSETLISYLRKYIYQIAGYNETISRYGTGKGNCGKALRNKLPVGTIKKYRETAISQRDHVIETLKEWRLLRDREIKEEYPHDLVKPKGTTIIIEGNTTGKYWTYNEVLEDSEVS